MMMPKPVTSINKVMKIKLKAALPFFAMIKIFGKNAVLIGRLSSWGNKLILLVRVKDCSDFLFLFDSYKDDKKIQ